MEEDGADAEVFSLAVVRRSSWQRCPISRLMLSSPFSPNGMARRKKQARFAPSLAGTALITSHMAAATVQASMVDLPPFCSFLLLAGAVVVSVVLARGAVPHVVCSIVNVWRVPRIARSGSRAKRWIGLGRDGRKAGHGPPVGRGRGVRNHLPRRLPRSAMSTEKPQCT